MRQLEEEHDHGLNVHQILLLIDKPAHLFGSCQDCMNFSVCNWIFLIFLGLIDSKLKFFHQHFAYFFDSNKLDQVSDDFSEVIFCIVEKIKLFLVIFDIVKVFESLSWIDLYLHNYGINESHKYPFKFLNLFQFVSLRPKLANLFDELPPKPGLVPPFHSLIM